KTPTHLRTELKTHPAPLLLKWRFFVPGNQADRTNMYSKNHKLTVSGRFYRDKPALFDSSSYLLLYSKNLLTLCNLLQVDVELFFRQPLNMLWNIGQKGALNDYNNDKFRLLTSVTPSYAVCFVYHVSRIRMGL